MMYINRSYIYLTIWFISLLALSFVIERANFPFLISCYSISFICYWQLCTPKIIDTIGLKGMLIAAILIRLIVVFAFPFFSDDIYRFWWDGKLLISGINPFDNFPKYYIDNQIFTDNYSISIFYQLNSPEYYSVYPPVCQTVFALSYWLSPNSIYGVAIAIKLFLLLCEIGTILILYLWAKEKAILYALNPLIIIELCGNAHFEAAMIFFFAFAIFLLKKGKDKQADVEQKQTFFSFFFDNYFSQVKWLNLFVAAFLFALSITSKLLTLLFLPFIVKNLGWNKGIVFSLSTFIFVILFFYPFFNLTFFEHFNNSLNLYFQKFEFNAAIYYIFKAIGNAYLGYTPTIWIAQFTSVAVFSFLLYFALKRGNFYQHLFSFFLFYLFFQRAIHPWYLSTLIFLSVFVNNKVGILWSGLIMLSYIHYWNNTYQENYAIIIVEYLILVIFSLFERKIFSKLS